MTATFDTDDAKEAAHGSDRNAAIRPLHLASGLLIALFVTLHIGNHVAMFLGPDAHISAMDALRPIYRNPIAETLLLAAIAFQAVSGAAMIWRTRRERTGLVPWAQAISGAYLLLFLANHVGAVLWGRFGAGLDTNFWFAAAGFHAGLAWFFAPYYWLAVAALFTHLGCAASWRLHGGTRVAVPVAFVGIGAALATGFVAAMARADAVPPIYLETYA